MNYKESKDPTLPPVYLFLGKEKFLTEEAIKKLKDVILEPGFENFDFDLFYGGDMSFSEIYQKLTLFPMGSKKRLVVVKDAEKIKEQKELLKYIDAPSKATVLVLVTEKPLKSPFVSKFSKKVKIVEFSIKSYEVINQLRGWLRDWKIEADTPTLKRLQELVGDSLSNLRSELEKLRLFMGDERRITKEMVDRVAGYSRTYTRYEFSRALGERNKKRALSILSQLYHWNERPESIVGVMTKELYDLFLAQAVDRDKNKLSRLLNRSEWVAEKVIERAKKWRKAELITLLRELSRLDTQYKQGRSPFSLIDLFIMERV